MGQGHIKVIGYYFDTTLSKETKEEFKYFLAYENSLFPKMKEKEDTVFGFNVLDKEHQISNATAFLNKVKKITKEEYLKGTKGYSTPEVFLK